MKIQDQIDMLKDELRQMREELAELRGGDKKTRKSNSGSEELARAFMLMFHDNPDHPLMKGRDLFDPMVLDQLAQSTGVYEEVGVTGNSRARRQKLSRALVDHGGFTRATTSHYIKAEFGVKGHTRRYRCLIRDNHKRYHAMTSTVLGHEMNAQQVRAAKLYQEQYEAIPVASEPSFL